MTMRTTLAFVALVWLGACANGPTLTPIPGGEAVAMSVTMSPQADGVVKISNSALRDDFSVGTGSGAVVGGLWGLTCGPFAVLCVPLGAGMGMITGAAAGTVVGLTGALPSEKEAQIRDRLARIQQAHPLLDQLKRQVDDRAQRHWNLGSARPSSWVTVELQDLHLTSTRDERIRCEVRVQVAVAPATGEAAGRQRFKLYEYVGSFSSLAVWLDESSDFVETSLGSAAQQIAAQIISDLAVK